jgi:hypothetical protein
VRDDYDDDRPRRRRPRDDRDYDDRPRRRPRDDDDSDRDDRRRAPASTSGKAVWSLVLGFLSFCLTVLAGIPAIALGLMGLGDVNRGGGRVAGRGLAITGIVLGTAGSLVSLGVIAVTFAYIVPKVEETKARQKARNDLIEIALAFHNYESTCNELPGPGAKTSAGQRARNLSWRVEILPYVEQGPLYAQFKLDEPWDSIDNLKLLRKMPKLYRAPGGPDDSTTTPYRVFVGGGAMFDWPRPTRLSDVQAGDGTANTIMVVEAAEEVPWTKPEELVYSPGRSLPKLGRGTPGRFTAVMGDGSARFFDLDRIRETGLRALITRAGGDEAPTD